MFGPLGYSSLTTGRAVYVRGYGGAEVGRAFGMVEPWPSSVGGATVLSPLLRASVDPPPMTY